MIPVFKPSIRRKDMDSVLTCLVSDSIGHGERAHRLAHEIASYLGLPGGTAVREYSRAIRLVFELLELPQGAGVLISPLAPSVYLSVMHAMGLNPIFVDVLADNGTISAREAESALSSYPAAIVTTSAVGFIPDMPALETLGLPIVEDVTNAIGGNLGERRCGSFGRFVIMGLEQENIVTSGGGAIVIASNKKDLASLKHAASALPGSALLSDMNASLGLTQIAMIEQFVQKRKEIAQVYAQALMKGRHKPLTQPGDGENVWYSFPVRLDGSMKEAAQYARKKGIETIPAFQDTIAAGLEFAERELPNARALMLRCVLFPLYPMLGKQNISQVSKVLSTLP